MRGHRYNKQSGPTDNAMSGRTRWRCARRYYGCKAAALLSTLIESRKGYSALIYQGYRYNKESRATASTMYGRTRWRCVRRNNGESVLQGVQVYGQPLEDQDTLEMYPQEPRLPHGRAAESTATSLLFTTSKQGRPVLIYQGNRFNKEYSAKVKPTNARTRWRCVRKNRGCRAFVTSRKGKPMVQIGGHRYYRHSSRRVGGGGPQLWVCVKWSAGCRCSIKTFDGDVIVVNGSHTHDLLKPRYQYEC
ncbi:unnamed protein product [Chrysodeixis includens]|uniref:FLYWCH-type domain-containing protein n=1 Tax=Chrysodeixis includens TaxID=689277 RepID=A0A9N8L227_CHRIL|nr:unnamed protein product [Chrysodeixis includens]